MALLTSRWLRAQFWILMVTVCLSVLVICVYHGFGYNNYGREQTGLIQPHTNLLPDHQIFRTEVAMEKTTIVPSPEYIKANGKLMEPVTAKWDRNVFFAIKSTTKFLMSRVRYLMLTWFQAVDKDMVSQSQMCRHKVILYIAKLAKVYI